MAQSKQASTTAATVPPRCSKFFVHGGHSLAASSRTFGVIGAFLVRRVSATYPRTLVKP